MSNSVFLPTLRFEELKNVIFWLALHHFLPVEYKWINCVITQSSAFPVKFFLLDVLDFIVIFFSCPVQVCLEFLLSLCNVPLIGEGTAYLPFFS